MEFQILNADKITFANKAIDEAALALCYRVDNNNLDPNIIKCKTNIIAAIEVDLKLSNSSVKQKIRASHDLTVDVTKFGDSLSDFVYFLLIEK